MCFTANPKVVDHLRYSDLQVLDIPSDLTSGRLTPGIADGRDRSVKVSSREERCALSAFRAGPGIHDHSRVGMQVHVRPGIQVQAAIVASPPV